MIIYTFSQNYEDMVLKFFQRLRSGTQKKFISKAGDFIILRKEENSQPTIKPNFISGALIPYLHGNVNYFEVEIQAIHFFFQFSLQKKNLLTNELIY